MENFWEGYYERFSYFSEADVRPSCHPRIMIHDQRAGRAIVLVHGLTDSPYFLTAIATHFHKNLGYDVYMPLLHMHGLREPDQMRGVALDQWQLNVRFAVEEASRNRQTVSIGGLSTGGALSLWAKLSDSMVNGELFLFSAAAGLSCVWGIIPGWVKECSLRIPGVACLDSGKPLVGTNPFRYDRVPLNSAVELVKLIQLNRRLLKMYSLKKRELPRSFIAWTEADTVVSISRLQNLAAQTGESRCATFAIPKTMNLEHACVVLEHPVYPEGAEPGDSPLEPANPLFSQMLAEMDKFIFAQNY